MRYVAAYLLAAMGGNKSANSADLEKILSSVGIEIDKDKLNKVVGELQGKDLNNLIQEGNKKLATVVPSGGITAASVKTDAPVQNSDSTAPPKPEQKQEVKKEESEESDEDMGFGLFD